MILFIVNSCTFNLHIHYNVTNKINQDKSTFHYILISTVMHQLNFLKIIITIFLVILNIWPQYALSEIIFLQLVWQNCNLGGTLWSWGEREHLCSIVKKKEKKVLIFGNITNSLFHFNLHTLITSCKMSCCCWKAVYEEQLQYEKIKKKKKTLTLSEWSDLQTHWMSKWDSATLTLSHNNIHQYIIRDISTSLICNV